MHSDSLSSNILTKVFEKLGLSSKHALSRNGPPDDATLYEQVFRGKEAIAEYFAKIGLILKEADGCFYMVRENESIQTTEQKLGRIIEAVRVLEFFTKHIEDFSEGSIFSTVDLITSCHENPDSEQFLETCSFCEKQSNLPDKVRALVSSLETRGYLICLNQAREEYQGLAALNYLYEILDLIEIAEEIEQAEPQETL